MNISETRPSEFQQLSGWIQEAFSSQRHFNIIGISGYGGIGKTYLLNMVLDSLRPQENFQSLILRVDGSNQAILEDFAALLDTWFAPRQLPPPAREGYDYFPKTRKLIAQHHDITQDVEKELHKKAPNEQVKRAAELLYRSGAVLNRNIPKTREYLDFESVAELHLEDCVLPAFELLQNLKSLSGDSWLPLPEGVKEKLGMVDKERIKHDFFGIAADTLYRDYSSILRGDLNYQNLILILDDFEILGHTLTDFIVTRLTQVLLDAHFRTTMIILGRDDLDEISPNFHQFLSPSILGKLRLKAFPEEVAISFLTGSGYSQKEANEIYRQTKGYPFLISLLAEGKNRAVGFYQRFYERTTKWMTAQEKRWLLPLCYLDEVNQGSIEEMIPDASPETVIHWFQKEASVRDMSTPVYCVNPFIREILLQYNKLTIGNKKHQELIERGKRAVAESQ